MKYMKYLNFIHLIFLKKYGSIQNHLQNDERYYHEISDP